MGHGKSILWEGVVWPIKCGKIIPHDPWSVRQCTPMHAPWVMGICHNARTMGHGKKVTERCDLYGFTSELFSPFPKTFLSAGLTTFVTFISTSCMYYTNFINQKWRVLVTTHIPNANEGSDSWCMFPCYLVSFPGVLLIPVSLALVTIPTAISPHHTTIAISCHVKAASRIHQSTKVSLS